MFLTLGMTFSYANVSSNNVKVNETKTELFSTSTVLNEIIYTNYDDDCKWYFVTTIKTTTYFLLGYAVLITVETDTKIECR